MGYSPRTYGGPESGRQWTETIDGKTFEYYTVIKDPGDGVPLGLSGNLEEMFLSIEKILLLD